MRALASVFGYIYSMGTLTPVCVPISRDEAGVLAAEISMIAAKKGKTIAGVVLTEVELEKPVFFTYLAVSRAARKAATAVILGREIGINPRSRFGIELARLGGRNLEALVLAPWRINQHDATKEGYTLEELNAALNEAYQAN
jgi:hypothetical protein